MVELRIAGRVNPIGIDCRQPDFSWAIESEDTGVLQTAYRMVIQEENGTPTWDSGEVLGDRAVEITYDGIPLKAATRYLADLRIWDNKGRLHEAEAFFETGLMLAEDDQQCGLPQAQHFQGESNQAQSSKKCKTFGDGAKWIGADELTLDAASACYFDLRMEITLAEGDRAGIVFGANDFRLKNRNFNIWGKAEALNYFKYEVDARGLIDGTSPTAQLNIYVVGMPVLGQERENGPEEADFTVEIPVEILNKDNLRQPMRIAIDTLSNLNQVSCTINGRVVDGKRQLNPLGNTHDYNTYPNLHEIGFATPAGGRVVYEHIEIHNPGIYSEGILFGEDTGATYGIFEGIEGVEVRQDGKIIVGSDRPLLVHRDPSYGSAPMLRKSFNLAAEATKASDMSDNKVTRARLYVSAQGIYELWLNGQRVGEDWFNPGNAQYRNRIAYHTYDVTALLREGEENVLSAQLAEGWWSGYQSFIVHNYNFYGDRQALMAKLVVDYEDGSSRILVTDESWSYFGNGPVEYGSFFQGERYNANKEIPGWQMPGFEEAGWRSAVEIPTEWVFDDYTFMTRLDEPVRIINVIQARSVRKSSIHQDAAGRWSYIYDMGENVLGVPEIEIPAGVLKQGDRLILRYAEILYPGHLAAYQEAGIADMMMVENYRAALSTDFYTAKNSEAVVIHPKNTYHGYRFIEITGLDRPLDPEQVKTCILSSIRLSSTYECSNPLVNRLYQNVCNSQNSNFISLPTDCPQRNERLGWTGDAQVFSMAGSYNGDVYNFYRQWLFTLRDDQFESGALPVFAPSYSQVYPDKPVMDANSFFCGVSWDAAIVLIPYNLYKQYGRRAIIRENMPAMVKYLEYLMAHPMTLGDRAYDGLTAKAGILADWLGIEKTDHTLINNAVFGYLLRVTAEMAGLIGDEVLAERYREAHVRTKVQWNALYVDEQGCTRDLEGRIQDTQASYATPLRYGMFDAVNEKQAVARYRETVKRTRTDKGNYTIKTGFSGTPNLVPTLSEHGFVEEAYRLFESTEYASWLYPVINGATSIWERWNSYTVDGGFNGNNSMNSFNHFSLGAIYEWMMGYQLGIMHDANQPGYKHFILQPQPGGAMTWARGSFESPYGRIKSGWTRHEDGSWKTYEARVPANTTAELFLPVEGAVEWEVCETVKVIGKALHLGQETLHFELGSGSFRFELADGKILASEA